jgi:hypothetical protein
MGHACDATEGRGRSSDTSSATLKLSSLHLDSAAAQGPNKITTAEAQGRMKANRSKAIIAAALASVIVATIVFLIVREPLNRQAKQLSDGTILVLNRVSFSETKEFTHGTILGKALGNLVPANGVTILSFKFGRPTRERFDCPRGKTEMAIELKLVGTNVANHPLVRPAFYREFRCVIRGESGIEYVEEFWRNQFIQYSDGCFAYVIASSYPRDSRKLWLRIERKDKPDRRGPWQQLAEFEITNPVRPIQPWTAEPPDTAKKTGDLEFSLAQITVATQAFNPRDIWNHVVTARYQVKRDGMVLTNWGPIYGRVEDATGNWDYFASHRSLDPRYVWKIDTDFEPQSDFQLENLLTVTLPKTGTSIKTNLMNIPLSISCDGNWVDGSIRTERTDLALKFVCVADDKGRKATAASGSWSKYRFRKGDFMMQTDGGMMMSDLHPVTATIAIVPTAHATFYAQPILLVPTNSATEFK